MASVERVALALLLAASAAALAQEPKISRLEHFTDNRGWNEAGIGPHFQILVTAVVSPSGFPTVVFAEREGERQAFLHYPQPSEPDLYILFQRFEPGYAGGWRVSATREETKSAPVAVPTLAKLQQVPFVTDLRVSGQGTQPRLSWKLPKAAVDIDRIRVGVLGGTRVHGRFMSSLYVSGDLPASATSFRIPAGVLAPGERYVFHVMLEDLEGGRLANRSQTYSDPYRVKR